MSCIMYEIVWASVCVERFRVFLENLSVALGEEEAVLVMDNAAAHRQAELLQQH